MYINCDTDPHGKFCLVFDNVTGEMIPNVKWANEESGFYGQIQNGRIVTMRGDFRIECNPEKLPSDWR